ncbi:lipase 3-like [Ochlerotatus camptorhynchus]|uniref:lipase 3-like n=1 Tax=Ochlerotatus camptorhynchus TaxID=644619 RepID=UPI0031E41CE6
MPAANHSVVSSNETCKQSTNLRNSIESHGYPVELHTVVTKDGYILTMSRIPSPRKTPILMVHQLFGCSVDYTVLGPEKSLAFLAHDSGYDVWMGNVRGNMFSRAHMTLDTKQSTYWKYSYHEIGIYDLPAMIDHILFVTGKQKLHYVGHSQGSVVFLVMASMLPVYNLKVTSVHLSAPVAFVSNTAIPIRGFSEQVTTSVLLMEAFGIYDVGGRVDNLVIEYLRQAISSNIVPEDIVISIFFYFMGEDRESFNISYMASITESFPAGGSIRQFTHFIQAFHSGRFAQYDYGRAENLKRYGSSTPPSYALDRITAPVALYFGANDLFLTLKDANRLADSLPNVVLKHLHPNAKWNHIDFIYSIYAHRVYRRVLDLIHYFEHR